MHSFGKVGKHRQTIDSIERLLGVWERRGELIYRERYALDGRRGPGYGLGIVIGSEDSGISEKWVKMPDNAPRAATPLQN